MIRSLFVVVLSMWVVQATSQLRVNPKFAPGLQEQLPKIVQQKPGDSVDMVVQWKKDVPVPSYIRVLQTYSKEVQVVRLAAVSLADFLQSSSFQFAGLKQQPVPELTTGSLDVSLNGLAAAHFRFPQYTGEGQHLSLREQPFDTADIDLRGRILPLGLAAGTTSGHASLMATIAAGGGNTAPEAKGAAPVARLSSAGFFNLLPLPDTQVQRLGIGVQNHSYGTVVENYYGAEAYAYDLQAAALPALVHVFSAGNSGRAQGAGPYLGLAGWGNLTGNFKYAKNVLVVGALDSFGVVPTLSSRGPAFDGRIKPELTAFGEDGSSGAAALVSGAAALVQQAYTLENGKQPPAALVRAVLLNSAFEVGAPGPDFHSGYGGLDGLAALQTIDKKQFRIATLQKGNTLVLPLNVPAGISQLKLTLSWTDSASSINTTKALVNDLDLQVRHQAAVYLPWVLNSNRDSLDIPTRTGIDTLNNNEQVTIVNPTAGQYEIRIDGRKLVSPEQQLAIAWQMDTVRSFSFTYPVGNTALEAGAGMLVRWQSTLGGDGRLEWKTPGGNWQSIENNLPLKRNYARWQVPDTLSRAQLRMVTGGQSFMSDTFVVSRRPPIRVGFLCGDSVLLNWAGQKGSAYQLYQLGSRYFEPLQLVQDTLAVVKLLQGSSGIYSIAPVSGGKPGMRSYALNAPNTGVGCYEQGFFVQAQDERSILLQAQLGTLYGLRSVRVQKRAGTAFTNWSQPIQSQLSFSLRDSLPVQGYNYYRLVFVLQDGREVAGEPLAVFHFGGLPVQVYPNPVQQGSSLYLQSILPGKYEVEVFDLYGKQHQYLRLQDVRNPIQVRWPAGMYFLRIKSDEGRVGVSRVVVY